MLATSERIRSLNARALQCDHGTRARYVAGCKCLTCKAAASRYATKRQAARKEGDTRELVDAGQVREHLNQLRQAGMSNRVIAAAAQVSLSIVIGIRRGTKLRVRRHIATRLLALPETRNI